MVSIGVIGAGVAGLHLALYLQKHGVEVTLYADRSPAEMRAGRLPNSVALMGATLARDTALGTRHWATPEHGTRAVRIRVAGDPPLTFLGALAEPFLFVDMRIYLPQLMEDFAQRGGQVVVAMSGPGEVDRLAAQHDLLVVATGRAGLTELFPRVPERSPYQEPQRRLFAGLFRGVRLPNPHVMSFNIVPGQGEVFENQLFTHDGYSAGLLVEAVPGGEFEPLTHLRAEEESGAIQAALLEILRKYVPDTYARIDPSAFALKRPLDSLSGAVLPVVRRGWAALPGGRLAMAVGDTHITHDPITGQGANAASRSAWLLGGLLAEQARKGGAFDQAFCVKAEQQLWENNRSTTEWTNAFLQPPPPHVIGLLVAAAQKQKVADAFVTNFNDPSRQWEVLSSPEATTAFIASP